MKRLALPLLLCLSLTPAQAQDAPAPEEDVEEGMDLIGKGAELLLRHFLSEMEPTLKDMEQALTEMEPAMRQLLEMVGDIRNYHAPERLPNGDIIIRRKTPLELHPAPEPAPGENPDGEIEL